MADAVEAFRSAFDHADENLLPKVLVDFRGVSGNLTTIQRFEFGAGVAAVYSSRTPARPLKVALLLDPSVIDPSRFGETVARNRGLSGRVTDDEAEALDFLNSDSRG